ncbi:MAG: peptidoglycan DD-metalloendopeptidase family protein, partial [Bacteroidota bacterium]
MVIQNRTSWVRNFNLANLVFRFTLIFILSCPILSTAQNTKENLQKTKKQLEQEIKYTNMLLEQTQQSKQASMSKLLLLTKQIEKREALLKAINEEIDHIDEEIVTQTSEVKKMSGELARMKDEYARMIYFAYKNMSIYNRMMFIFSAEDFNQAFNRLKYYQQYSSYRRTQAEIIKKSQVELTQKVNELEITKEEKTHIAVSKEQEKTRLLTEKESKDKTVKELSQKEKQLTVKLKEKQQAAQKLQNEIEKLIAKEIKASEDRARKTAKTEKKPAPETSGNEMMLTPVEKQLSTNFAANRGKLPWPSEKGIIVNSFGEHNHPVLKYVKVKNNGVDIATEQGAAVRSVFSGKISRVMSFPNLNKVVIIRHGEYLTVYCNLDEVTVQDGQEINTSQIIGKVHTN